MYPTGIFFLAALSSERKSLHASVANINVVNIFKDAGDTLKAEEIRGQINSSNISH